MIAFTDFFHIFNPNSSRKNSVQQLLTKNNPLPSMWIERTSHPTHLETVVQWAWNEGRHALAIWGGDGTFSRVVQALVELNALGKMTVMLIPVGTCNDLAKKLQIPYWKKAFHTARQGRASEHHLDIGILKNESGSRTFINNAGFGRTRQRFMAKSNPISDILSFSEKRLDLAWENNEGKHFENRAALLGVVCNGPFFNGGMHFDRDISVNDGLLNGFFESPQSTSSLFFKFAKSKLGFSLLNTRTFGLAGAKIAVESNEDLYPQVDGEPAVDTAVRKLEFSVLPQKLRMILWS